MTIERRGIARDVIIIYLGPAWIGLGGLGRGLGLEEGCGSGFEMGAIVVVCGSDWIGEMLGVWYLYRVVRVEKL